MYAVGCYLIFLVFSFILIETKDKSEARVIEDFRTKKLKFLDFK
jgi:hypothetical protein